VETAIWEKERELKDSLQVLSSKEMSEVDPKSPNSMLAMLVGKPMDLGGHLDTALPPGAPTRTCWAEGTGQSPCRNGGRGEVAGGCGT